MTFTTAQINVSYRNVRGQQGTEAFTLKKTGNTVSVQGKDDPAAD